MIGKYRVICCILLFLLLTLPCCSDKESGILLGQFPGSKVQKVSPGNLIIKYFNYAEAYVVINLKFYQIVTPAPTETEGYTFIETRSDYGTLWVLANTINNGTKIKKLNKGDIFKVVGTVSALTIKGFEKPQIVIIAE